MDKKKIEANDQRLMKNIRDIVRSKEKKPVESKPVWRSNIIWLPVLCAGLIVAGLMAYREKPSTTASNNSGSIPQNTLEQSESATVTEKKDQRPHIMAEDMAQASEAAEKTPLPSDPRNDPHFKMAFSRQVPPEPAEQGLNAVRSTVPPNAGQPNPVAQSGVPSRIQISKLVTCTRVSKKQFVSPQKIFSLRENPKPVVWMRVLSDNPPFTLTHVYYVNEHRYCAVPLKIRYPHMRTWSNVTLTHRDHTGKWRVEVITERGEILDQVEFAVVP